MTCSWCRTWVATSREQYKQRTELVRAYPGANRPCPVCLSADWSTIPPPGISRTEIIDELDREHREKMRLEEKRRKGHWLLFWRHFRSP